MGLAEDLIGTQLNDLETLERMESEIVSMFVAVFSIVNVASV